MTQLQYQGLEVVEQRNQLIAPHKGGKLTFVHPPYGRGTYANVGLAIAQDNLKRPTMAETASLVHAAFAHLTDSNVLDNKYAIKIRYIMERAWLWAFTGTLYVPKEGAFIQDDPEIRDGMPFMSLDDLVQKLNAKDPSVRHVPFGYKVEEMSASELAKNAYVIGLVGEEGAEKLAGVAEEFSYKPCLPRFRPVNGNVTRVSSLYINYLNRGLVVCGNRSGKSGRAFAVLK